MSTYLYDTFTDTDGTLLTNHAADVGSAWTGADGWKIVGNAAVPNPDGGSLIGFNSITSSGNDDLMVEFTMSVGRLLYAASEWILGQQELTWIYTPDAGSGDTLTIQKVSGGNLSVIASTSPGWTFPFASPKTIILHCDVSTGNWELLVDGVSTLSGQDSDVLAFGGGGTYLGGDYTTTIATDLSVLRMAIVSHGAGWPDGSAIPVPVAISPLVPRTRSIVGEPLRGLA